MALQAKYLDSKHECNVRTHQETPLVLLKGLWSKGKEKTLLFRLISSRVTGSGTPDISNIALRAGLGSLKSGVTNQFCEQEVPPPTEAMWLLTTF